MDTLFITMLSYYVKSFAAVWTVEWFLFFAWIRWFIGFACAFVQFPGLNQGLQFGLLETIALNLDFNNL